MKSLSPYPSPGRGEAFSKRSPLSRKGLAASLFALLGMLFTWSCSPSLPNGILDEDEMTDILVDFHLAQGMAEAQGATTEIDRYNNIQAVFRKHHVTEAEFDSSMVYWLGKSEDLEHIYEDVVTRIQAQAQRMGLETTTHDQFANLTNEGDTANIWMGKDFACVAANPVQCVYSFSMKADTTFRAGDSFIWRFATQFVGRSMNNEAVALLNFYYDTDTTICITELLRNSPKNELIHRPGATTDSLSLRSISGFIYLPSSGDADPPKPLLISDMKLIRMHKPEPVPPVAPVDTISTDSLSSDTLAEEQNERLSPLQVRESQPKKRTINVVKENPNPIRPQQGIPARNRRRR